MDNKSNFKACTLTLGCRVNQYESDAISEALEKRGVMTVPFGQNSDICIINTCSVTAESDRKSRQMIRRSIKKYPGKPIIVCGCYAQNPNNTLTDIEGVSVVCGNSGKDDICEIACRLLMNEKIDYKMKDISESKYDNLSLTTPQRVRSYIKIEDGCDNKCAYCIIPSLRGKVRSRDPQSIICEARVLVAAGCKEIVLVGIETASYGTDFKNGITLVSILEEISKIDGISRISMGSLDPTIMKPDFVKRISTLPAIAPHFHISLQSGTTATLNRMRRKYNAEQAERFIKNMREYMPDAMLSADIIVGFPGETDEDFAKTVDFCKRNRLFHLHIFPYSIRQGTEAATMVDQVPDVVKNLRLEELSDVQNKIKEELLDEYLKKHISVPFSVLFEQNKNGRLYGHTEHNVEVYVESDVDLSGEILPAVAIKRDGHTLVCKIKKSVVI